MMDRRDLKFDVFISYASEDRGWVEERIVRPLHRCRTVAGMIPSVFFDHDRHALEVGQSWSDALTESIRQSRSFVPIYSSRYFDKEMCRRELDTAYVLGTSGAPKIAPVLIDLTSQGKIPPKMLSLQFIAVDMQDWFQRLCDGLNLQASAEVLTLQVRTLLPPTVIVNNTLPPIEVEVTTDSRARVRDVEITLSARRAELRGTVNAISRHGVAVFDDLSFVAPTERDILLLATADGCVSHASNPFRVVRPASVAAPAGTRLITSGDPIFFAGGNELIVHRSDRFRVWTAEGKALGAELPITAPIRLMARDASMIGIADWTGRVRTLTASGETAEWTCAAPEDGLTIPGGLALAGGTAYVGFWNGDVYELRAGAPPRHMLHHPAGVQCLAVLGDSIALVDLSGRLTLYEEDRLIGGVETGEPCVHSLTAVAHSLILVGEHHLLKYLPASETLLKEPLRLAGIRGVLSDSETPVVCDVQGRGFRFDAGLTPRRRFQVPAGARPASADHHGEWAVFRQTDGTSLVLSGHRVVYTHAGPLAVSPDGQRFAVGEAGGLRLVDRAELEDLIGRRPDGET